MKPTQLSQKLSLSKSLKKDYETSKSLDKISETKENAPAQNMKDLTMAELDEIIKKADEKIHQKKMEFDFISKIDKNEVSNYMLQQGTDSMATLGRRLEKSPEKKKDETSLKDTSLVRPAWMDLPERKLGDKLERKKQTEKVVDVFYDPIPPKRVTELHQTLKKRKGNYSLEQSNKDAEKLDEEYYNRYGGLMKNQYPQEIARVQRNKNMAEIQEMRAILREKLDLEHPMIWNKNSLDPKDAIIANETFNRKIRELSDPAYKFRFEYDTDITKKIDTYLNGIYELNVDTETEKYEKGLEFEAFIEDKK